MLKFRSSLRSFFISAAVASLLQLTNAGAQALAQTPAELLQKGIYAEETVGDLDQAIQVYQSVVKKAEASRDAAATAQLRIGLCLQKQGKTDKATSAFQRVVDQYPDQKQIIAQAKQHLPLDAKLLPAPWGNGDEMHLEMKLSTGVGAGVQVYRIAADRQSDRDCWTCDSWQLVSLNGQVGKSRVVTDRETFAPISSIWKHSQLGKANAVYSDDQVTIKLISRDDPVKLPLDPPFYDNEQCAEVFRRLPLAVGYQTNLDIVATLSAAQIPLGVEVTKLETIEVPAGTFECFRLDLSIGQTFWIANNGRRHLVQFQAGGVTAKLTKVITDLDRQPTTIETDRYEAIVPADWYAYSPSDASSEARKSFLIDPHANVQSRVESGPLNKVQSKHPSAAQWLTASMEQYKERLKDFSLADEGIKEISLENVTAVEATFTFTEGDTPMTGRRIAAFGKSSAINLRFTMATQDVERSSPEIDQIIQSVSVK